MKLTSPDFEDGGSIPPHFTCTGDDVNPELRIEDMPEGTKSLVLMIVDTDSIAGTWLHWLVYDIPPAERIVRDSVPGKQGMNTFKKTEYGGPCPTVGTHHYHFRIWALDILLGLAPGASKEDVEKAMAGHVLTQAELVGLYSRPPSPVGYREINI